MVTRPCLWCERSREAGRRKKRRTERSGEQREAEKREMRRKQCAVCGVRCAVCGVLGIKFTQRNKDYQCNKVIQL